MSDEVVFIPEDVPPFAGSAWCRDLTSLSGGIAIFGMRFGQTYFDDGFAYDNSEAPDAVRRASKIAFFHEDRYDFDLDGTVLDNRTAKIVDLGNIVGNADSPSAIFERAERLTRLLSENGVLPIVLGGDHSIPIPVMRGLESHDDVVVVQIDAHLDWRDDVGGIKVGQSSPMRRASELRHIGRIFQIGMRGQGSARPADIAAARAYGATIIKAEEVHDRGINEIIKILPEGQKYYITIDGDGFDPSVMPGVYSPTPGGLSFYQVAKIVRHLATIGQVVGMDVVEIAPRLDVNSISSVTAARLIGNLIGSAVRNESFHPKLCAV